MIQEGKIGSGEAAAIPMVLLSLNALFSSIVAVDHGMNAGWMVILLAGALTCVGVFFISQLMNYYPDKSLIEVSREVLGPIPGFLVSIIYFNTFLLGATLFLRLEAERINTVYLPDTPVLILVLAFTVAGMFGTYVGLEALSRSIKILSLLILASFVVPLLMTYNFWDFNNLFPFWGSGGLEIGKGGLLMSGMFSEIILLAIIYPSIKVTSPRMLWYQPLLVAIFINVLVMLITLLAFPIPAINENLYPIVQTSRLINLGRFLRRVDAIFAFFWMMAITLKFILLFYAANVTLARLLQLPYYKPFIVPLGIIVFSAAFIPNDLMQAADLVVNQGWRWNGLIIFTPPLIILIVHYLKPKGNSKPEKGV